MTLRILALLAAMWVTSTAVAQHPTLTMTQSESAITIKVDDQSIAAYIYQDDSIPRPYFAHVKAPGGIQVTRNHPPQQGDRDDHATLHPGIWIAFGDLGGVDFWRNKGSVKHVEFTQPPAFERNMGSFIQKKQYEAADGSVVCQEEFRFAILATGDAYFMALESHFSGEQEFAFGDQEEMGLGIRVATPISEVGGGGLTDADGRKGAKQIWGHAPTWCDYSGTLNGKQVGMTVMSHPNNFRKSWFHVRDYGLLAANPFGRAAMKRGEPSKVVVKPGETLALRYAIWIHADAHTENIQSAYNTYSRLGR